MGYLVSKDLVVLGFQVYKGMLWVCKVERILLHSMAVNSNVNSKVR